MTDAISSTAGTASTLGATSSNASKRSGIADNFDAFLMLLTTQLKTQSPLDPLDSNQFTEQLVQFASVEQQIRSNDTLNALLTSAKASSALSVASFIGKQITADGATTRLANGQAKWLLNAGRAATQATITIRGKDGVVATFTQPLKAGAQEFTWDGRTSSGGPAPDGDYTITVTAKDATGQGVTVKTEISGRVDSVDLSGETAMLAVGSLRIPIGNVKSIGPSTD